MQIENNDKNLSLVVYQDNNYRQIHAREVLEDMDIQTLKQIYTSNKQQIVYHTFVHFLIDNKRIKEEEIDEMIDMVNEIPIYDLLYSDHNIEVLLKKKMGEESFIELENKIIKDFTDLIDKHFGIGLQFS